MHSRSGPAIPGWSARLSLGAGILAALLTTTPALAQEAPGPNVQLVPKIGVFTAINELGAGAELENGLALGLAVELYLPGSPVTLRANLEWVDTRIAALGTGNEVGDATITVVVADAVFRPLPPTALLQPYVMGGAGIKRYELGSDNGGGGTGLTEGTSNRFTAHIGGGFDVRLGPLAVLLEVSDYVSSFRIDGDEAELQNDLFALIGFRIGMF